MFRTLTFLVALLLIATVYPLHAAQDDNRSIDEYSGHDGQATLPDPNDIGTPSFNEIRSSLDQGSDQWEPTYASYTPASAPKDLFQTPPPDFSTSKAPSVYLTFGAKFEDKEDQSKELQEFKNLFVVNSLP